MKSLFSFVSLPQIHLKFVPDTDEVKGSGRGRPLYTIRGGKGHGHFSTWPLFMPATTCSPTVVWRGHSWLPPLGLGLFLICLNQSQNRVKNKSKIKGESEIKINVNGSGRGRPLHT
ncbi:MAG: hypothetical protein WCA13_18560, partial [Terriglobales bacterium]